MLLTERGECILNIRPDLIMQDDECLGFGVVVQLPAGWEFARPRKAENTHTLFSQHSGAFSRFRIRSSVNHPFRRSQNQRAVLKADRAPLPARIEGDFALLHIDGYVIDHGTVAIGFYQVFGMYSNAQNDRFATKIPEEIESAALQKYFNTCLSSTAIELSLREFSKHEGY